MGKDRSLASIAIVAGRLLLATVAAAAVVFGFVSLRELSSDSGASQMSSYVCPMHPEVTSPSP